MRQTREQIDAGIVEAAAALLAENGVERTSLREIAEAVGYSKTGLLHRFGSKDSLLEAVADSCLDAVRAVAEDVAHLPEGPERDAAAAAGLSGLAVSAPGRLAIALAQEGALDGSPLGERLAPVPALLSACFSSAPAAAPSCAQVSPHAPVRLGGPDAERAGLERAARVTAALAASLAVAEQFRHHDAALLRPLLERIALDVLQPTPAPASPAALGQAV
ncbi:TetR/AcrR family transcriptional regulator [Quadrisphaera setariae]|uniref:Helix-turn-helix transcriptional regulator n=1 Tax=Quadrisphaera setariae TaxID=2593304 RepID=A0A5C8ZEX2_9ACTN|nr:helix-turn-helix domain-containing protein [Quadrisphaera setariae]TXR56054.1 helix-turn-helix transcriptional regulator [Quadrisphaera setariae]